MTPDYTLIAEFEPYSGGRVAVAESLNGKVCEWGIKLNASKMKTMIVSRCIASQPH